MKLSIIIPIYNEERFVDQCLKSILHQNLDCNDYEVIVINDGSTDGSASILRDFENTHSNFHVYEQKNSGVGSARNKGLEFAKGDYIYFIDPDDYLASGVLNDVLNCAFLHDLDVLTFLSTKTKSRDLLVSETNNVAPDEISILSGLEYISALGYRNEVWWYLVKRSFLEKIGLKFILGKWMEDAIFTAKLFTKASRVSHIPIDIHRYVTVENSAMTSRKSEHYIKVIYDLGNAAEVFNELIEEEKKAVPVNKLIVSCLEERQQSFVFILMVRILKSNLKFSDVKVIIEKMTSIGVYPINKYLNVKHKYISNLVLIKLFNVKFIYYSLFLILNPFLKHVYRE